MSTATTIEGATVLLEDTDTVDVVYEMEMSYDRRCTSCRHRAALWLFRRSTIINGFGRRYQGEPVCFSCMQLFNRVTTDYWRKL